MRRNAGVFLGEEKLDSEIPLILPSFDNSNVIPLHFKQELRLQSQMSVNDSEMTLENFNRVLSPLRRQHPIKVF